MKTLKNMIAIVIAVAVNITLLAQETSINADRISLEAFEAKLKQASPNPQIVDVRTAEEFKLNHLKGAVQVDLTNETAVKQLISKLDKKKPVFVYSINNGRSAVFVKALKEQQFTEAYELPGGISKWVGAGRPIETNTSIGLTTAEYKKLLLSDKLVLVEVGSKYCGGCTKLAPIVEEVNSEHPDKLKVVKIELFDNRQLGKELNIQSIPTLILYKGDKIVWQKNGKISKTDIEAALHQEVASK